MSVLTLVVAAVFGVQALGLDVNSGGGRRTGCCWLSVWLPGLVPCLTLRGRTSGWGPGCQLGVPTAGLPWRAAAPPPARSTCACLLARGAAALLTLPPASCCLAVLAIGGVGGLAVGLAGREILENLFAGLIILSSNPFEVGADPATQRCAPTLRLLDALVQVMQACPLPWCLLPAVPSAGCTVMCEKLMCCLPWCRWETRCCSAPRAGRLWRASSPTWAGTEPPSAPLSARSTTSQTRVGGRRPEAPAFRCPGWTAALA